MNGTLVTNLVILDSVTSIGSYAFQGCTSLESVTIGNGVESIGNNAFICCYKLVEVYNLSSLDITKGSYSNGYVGYYALDIYTSVNEESKLDTTDDGYIFYADGSTIYLVGYIGSDTELTLPDDYNGSNYEIYEYAFYKCTSLTSVTIPDGVTSIGSYAFYRCTRLTSVTIGSGVESIGYHAFYDCYKLVEVYNLSSLNITKGSSYEGYIGYYALNVYTPNSGESKLHTTDDGYVFYAGGSTVYLVRYVGSDTELTLPDDYDGSSYEIYEDAFSYCSRLTSVTIGNGVESIGDGAFYRCTSLESITIPDSVKSIGSYAFGGCTSLESVIIGSGVESIEWYAFKDCTSLESVTIGSGVKSIADNAFRGCTSLNAVYITDISAWCNINFNIDFYEYASNPLYYAHKLYLNGTLVTDLVIPDSVTSISDYAFYDCDSLTSVTIGNGVTSIGDCAFEDCTSLESVTIGNGVESIGDDAFHECTSLNAVYITDIGAWCSIDFAYYYANPLYCADNLYLNGSVISGNIVIPEGTQSIGTYAFYHCSQITEITIPDSVESIGDGAFYGCTSLASVTIGNGVESIGDGAFYGCSRLTSVTIGNGVTSISDYAFYDCDSLTSITIPDSVTSIGSRAFCGCSSLASVTIGNGVESIGDYAFYDCYKLVEVYDLSSLNITKGSSYDGYIGYYALNVYTPNSGESKLHTTDDGYVFYAGGSTVYLVRYVGSDTELTLPDNYNGSNYEIYEDAFSYCSRLTSVTIGNGVKSIGYMAFEGCTSLERVTIPDSVTSIGDGAFYGCTSLEKIHCPEGSCAQIYAIYNDINIETCIFGTDNKCTVCGYQKAVLPNDNSNNSDNTNGAGGQAGGNTDNGSISGSQENDNTTSENTNNNGIGDETQAGGNNTPEDTSGASSGGGCASAIGGSFALVATLGFAAAFIGKKRKIDE